jgi:hypothetical protein
MQYALFQARAESAAFWLKSAGTQIKSCGASERISANYVRPDWRSNVPYIGSQDCTRLHLTDDPLFRTLGPRTVHVYTWLTIHCSVHWVPGLYTLHLTDDPLFRTLGPRTVHVYIWLTIHCSVHWVPRLYTFTPDWRSTVPYTGSQDCTRLHLTDDPLFRTLGPRTVQVFTNHYS